VTLRPRARTLSLLGTTLIAALALASAPAHAQTATVISFDGTPIHVNFFPAAGLKAHHRAPTVLVGPGWGSAGDTNPNSKAAPDTGIPGLGPLRAAGFNVLTWDPRGFGASGGAAQVDSPSFEGRDVSAIITWLAHRPEALLDAKNDPRVGMAGGSYGGGIQLVTAAIDKRVDAIVPDIAWHSLITSLDKNNTPKTGWSTLLYLAGLAGSHGHLNPLIGQAQVATSSGQPLTPQERHFFATRGAPNLIKDIHVPTLLVQGTVDTLFSLQEAVTNYAILKADHVPVKMLWFCGGHGICLDKPGDTALIVHDTVSWLKRYLMRDSHVHTGPGFQWVDQKGHEHASATYPLAARTTAMTAHGAGTLAVNRTGGAGPVVPPPGSGALGGAAAGITPAKATNAINLRLPAPTRTRLLMWAPQLTVTYRGTATKSATRVFAQLVDDITGEVLGHQITPVPVTLDGKLHTLKLPLEIVAAAVARGEHLTLQITPSTVAYQAQQAIGSIRFTSVRIVVPAS
jgi:ABC-2 type transport system ATP-binding protein